MSDTTQTEAPVEVVPFTNDLTKAEMIEHLVKAHGFHAYQLRHYTSAYEGGYTKKGLLEFHEDQHRAMDAFDAAGLHYSEGTEKAQQVANDLGLRRWPIQPAIAHVHTIEPVSEAVAAAAKSLTTAKDNTPIASLSATERKALKDVVDNDFNMLKSEMKAMGADMRAQRRREVEAEWAERRNAVTDFEAKARRTVAKAVKALRDLQTDATAAGVVLSVPSIHPDYVRGEVKGFEQALREAETQVERDLERALLTLERQRLTAQRQVLLTGVSGEVAQQVLGSIPNAQTLMVQAAQESASKQIDA